MTCARASAFGLIWQADIALPYFRSFDGADRPADVSIRCVPALADRTPLHQVNRGFVYSDGVRFAWGDVVIFDMFEGCRVDYLPGPAWQNELPISFFSTLAALIVAWRGVLPFHGSTVMVDDRAILVCGDSGTGKSTLTAALIAEGAKLVSDDLSVVDCDASGRYVVRPGRPSLRLHPETARWIEGSAMVPAPEDDRGKFLVTPDALVPDRSVPLTGVVILCDTVTSFSAAQAFQALRSNIFRPKWMAHLPAERERRQHIFTLAHRIWIEAHPPLKLRSRAEFQSYGGATLAMIRTKAVGSYHSL